VPQEYLGLPGACRLIATPHPIDITSCAKRITVRLRWEIRRDAGIQPMLHSVKSSPQRLIWCRMPLKIRRRRRLSGLRLWSCSMPPGFQQISLIMHLPALNTALRAWREIGKWVIFLLQSIFNTVRFSLERKNARFAVKSDFG